MGDSAGTTGVGAGTRAADCVIGAALVGADGVGAVVLGQEFRPYLPGIGGEAAKDGCRRTIRLYQRRAEVTRVGQAVANENRLGVFVLGKGGTRRTGKGQGQGAANKVS